MDNETRLIYTCCLRETHFYSKDTQTGLGLDAQAAGSWVLPSSHTEGATCLPPVSCSHVALHPPLRAVLPWHGISEARARV